MMVNSVHRQLFSQYLRLFLPIFLLLLSGQKELQAEAQQQFDTPNKLFVFGDSTVDVGNTPKVTDGWKVPYGQAFPGEPVGRFSDGRVLSDYIAMHFGLPSPIPYESRNDVPPNELKHGLNFAYGGTGLFDTIVPFPNMTTQINFLEKLIQENVFSDLSNSMATLSSSGNDYLYFLNVENGSIWEAIPFINRLVDQMTSNLIKVQSLGVKKIAVTSVPPFGCIPRISSQNPFKRCFEFINIVANYHNTLLKQSITKLNQETTDGTTFLFIDIYKGYMSVIRNPSKNNMTNVYSGCCVGVGKNDTCGSVGVDNEPKYTVCENPESTLFWDIYHPTQAGWRAIYNNLDKGDLGAQLPLSSIMV